jgi:hypothetical protein
VALSKLEIAGRAVARSADGALDAEYALFEPADLERKATDGGPEREVGYKTTVATARTRLGYIGVTETIARVLGDEVRPLAETYARGPAARRVAKLLGATELFEGGDYDAKKKAYRGVWLDLPALARDLGLAGAPAALQAVHLAALLADARDDGEVTLDTAELMLGRRPTDRTYVRVDLDAVPALALAIRTLAGKPRTAPPAEREAGLSRTALLAAIAERKAWSAHAGAQVRLAKLELTLTERDRPTKGPLADAELWALERQMGDGRTSGVIEKLDELERQHGRTPATTYLRARASLMRKLEEPAVIAGRVAALALSITNFPELQLLAAQAWLAGGDNRRATPYARDLMENSAIDPELRKQAEALYFKANPDLEPTAKFQRASASSPPSSVPASAPPPPTRKHGEAEDRAPDTAIDPTPVVAVGRNPTVQQLVHVPQPPSARPPSVAPAASKSGIPPSLDPSVRASVPYSTISGERSSRASTRPKAPAAEARRASVAPETTPSESAPVRTPTSPPAHTKTSPPLRTPSVPPKEPKRASSGPRRAEPEEPSPVGQVKPPRYMAGASQPPFRADDGREVRSPRPPRVEAFHSEAAEHLSLPPGATADFLSLDAIPRTIPEARTLFTHLSRDLGSEYRVEHGIELRTEVAAIEAMQAHLFEKYHGHKVRSLDDWLDVRRHGAFLSEILSRTVGAEWIDISSSELGYWTMSVPNGTRVQPFARVLRYLAMGPKERDLVSYYLELRHRATGR